MKNPTKVTQTIPLEEVPSWAVEQVECRAFKALRSAQEELSHLVKQTREKGEADPQVIAHHIHHARTGLADVDAVLADAHVVISGYLQHLEELGIASLEEKMEDATGAVQAARGASDALKRSKKDE